MVVTPEMYAEAGRLLNAAPVPADLVVHAYDDLVARLRPTRAVDAETGFSIRFVRDYIFEPDLQTLRWDWCLRAVDHLPARVQSGRERLGE